jgi:CHAT domain-containing protein
MMIGNTLASFHRIFSRFKRLRSPILYGIIALVFVLLCSTITPVLAIAPTVVPNSATPGSAPTLVEQGRSRYEAGQLVEAATLLQQAAAAARSQQDRLTEAIALSNLSLVQQQLGNWAEATQAIEQAMTLLRANPDQGAVLAQALEVQGRLQLSQGNAEAALATWQQAGDYYDRLQDQSGILRSGINQAQALQTLGLYRRAITTLDQLADSFSTQTPTPAQVVALRSLGDALRVAGSVEQSIAILNRSLAIAEQLNVPQQVAATQLSLANALYAQGDTQQALTFYQQTITTGTALPIPEPVQHILDRYQQAIEAGSQTTQLQAQLNRLRLLVDLRQDATVQTLLPDLTAQLDRLPPSRPAIYARINLAHRLIDWQPRAGHSAQLLATAIEQAQRLKDVRAESFARGTLGGLYEQRQQWAEAQQVTTTALQLAQQIAADDLSYRWHWQRGRILSQQQQREKAIVAYTEAVYILGLLRKDLTAINPDVQFSFRETVEPIYRQFVALLLQPDRASSQKDLEQARTTIESLQLAELDNFFRTACLDAQAQKIEDIDQQAAVLYPIILSDRLEVILSLPSGKLHRYTQINANKQQVEAQAALLLSSLKQVSSNDRVLPIAQQFYDWLIRPAEAALAENTIKTLVFVLDGVLRNIPMAVLHDGNEYLVEKPYSLALTPGLQLLTAQPLTPRRLSVLLGGLSEARPPFPPLLNVISEFSGIQSKVADSQELLNDRFTNDEIQKAISAVPFPVVHLATHGVFDSERDNTFILTWSGELNIDQLRELLQSTELGRRRPIELLVLSACETAEGDDRAALGLAGVAVRAGARSTVATLWQVNDEAMSILMKQFYQELAQADATHDATNKAAALRQAQRSLLHDANNPQYARPYYWSSVVLVGNWQ